MGIVDLTEVKGYCLMDASKSEVVCTECITEVEEKDLTEKDFLTERDLDDEEKAYFCDRCKERMN